ncbi:MAG TPA: proline--tRNA ligase [Bryobacteraceae bacterium]|nr:proline--tRNA ligase [Bryobacteraceae bacterium]
MAESPITAREKDFATWYQDVVLQGDMAEPAEIVKGCMVIKPNGYAVWEVIQRELDTRFKASGHQNLYFPLLIPESFLRKEAEHVEGFSPELAIVTIAGGKKLEENYVIRPTSETIIGHFFARWIQSYRDLPLLYNQWANVMRWELRTRLFLRTSEFLWQEGHTAHSSHEEAMEEVIRMLHVYADVTENVMAMPVVRGLKTQAERFAGALRTYSIEAMMQNGLALQAGTSHDLGQNFGKAFEVQFQTKEGKLDYVWQTSWGVSTRLVGGLIMTHSDDKGLVLPPKVAPVKAVIVPIYRKDEERAQVMEVAARLANDMGGILGGIQVDQREGQSPGAKFFHWERRGVPVVFELGPRDLASGNIVMKRRDTGSKEVIAQADAVAKLNATLETIQTDLFNKAKQRLKDNTVLANSIEEVESILNEDVTAEKGGGKFVMAHLADDPSNDRRIKEFKASVRNIPLVDEFDGPGKCILTGVPVEKRVVIAKAY